MCKGCIKEENFRSRLLFYYSHPVAQKNKNFMGRFHLILSKLENKLRFSHYSHMIFLLLFSLVSFPSPGYLHSEDGVV